MGLSWPWVGSPRSPSSRSSANISKSSEARESRGLGAGAIQEPWTSASPGPGLGALLGSVTSSSRLIIQPVAEPSGPAPPQSPGSPKRWEPGPVVLVQPEPSDSPQPQAGSLLLPAPTLSL